LVTKELDVLIDDLRDRLAGYRSDDPFLLLSALKDDQGRNSSNPELLRNIHVLVNIHLIKSGSAFVFLGNCLD